MVAFALFLDRFRRLLAPPGARCPGEAQAAAILEQARGLAEQERGRAALEQRAEVERRTLEIRVRWQPRCRLSTRSACSREAPMGGRYAQIDLGSAQRAIAETALWHVRVLAGWMPPRGIELVRILAAWFELANAEDRLAYLVGGPLSTPFALGGLATAGASVHSALSVAELREALKESPWGDPGEYRRVTRRARAGLRLGARRDRRARCDLAWRGGLVAPGGAGRRTPGR